MSKNIFFRFVFIYSQIYILSFYVKTTWSYTKHYTCCICTEVRRKGKKLIKKKEKRGKTNKEAEYGFWRNAHEGRQK